MTDLRPWSSLSAVARVLQTGRSIEGRLRASRGLRSFEAEPTDDGNAAKERSFAHGLARGLTTEPPNRKHPAGEGWKSLRFGRKIADAANDTRRQFHPDDSSDRSPPDGF